MKKVKFFRNHKFKVSCYRLKSGIVGEPSSNSKPTQHNLHNLMQKWKSLVILILPNLSVNQMTQPKTQIQEGISSFLNKITNRYRKPRHNVEGDN